MSLISVLLIIVVFVLLLALLYAMSRHNMTFNVRVLSGLVLGLLFGAALQLIFGTANASVSKALEWITLVGSGYIRLLKMIIVPLVLVSITSAFINQKGKGLGKMAGLIIAVLLVTVSLAALVGALTTAGFNLNANDIVAGESELAKGQDLENKLLDFTAKPIQQQILEIIPDNVFASMSGQGNNSTLAVVFFASFLSLAVLELRRLKPDLAEKFARGVQVFHDIVMRMISIIMRLTPYSVLALMCKVAATSDVRNFGNLLLFLIASYVALAIMFVIHLLILLVFKLNPLKYLKKSTSPLLFAFTSRTSAGTLPLTVEALTRRLGVPEGPANLAASLAVSIGQNGCAGVYPAMLAVMIAPTIGIDPLDPLFLIKLIVITAIASFGIAGVGGGATFAALTVLSSLGFPVALAGLLIAIEPLIDMGRTLLNVSDGMITALVSAKALNQLDEKAYNDSEL